MKAIKSVGWKKNPARLVPTQSCVAEETALLNHDIFDVSFHISHLVEPDY